MKVEGVKLRLRLRVSLAMRARLRVRVKVEKVHTSPYNDRHAYTTTCLSGWFGFGFGFSGSGSVWVRVWVRVRVLIKFKVRVRFGYRPCSLDGGCVRHKPATIMKVIATVIRLPYT